MRHKGLASRLLVIQIATSATADERVPLDDAVARLEPCAVRRYNAIPLDPPTSMPAPLTEHAPASGPMASNWE